MGQNAQEWPRAPAGYVWESHQHHRSYDTEAQTIPRCFTLRSPTLLSPTISKPIAEITAIARVRANILSSRHRHCVAVHVRGTDKQKDGGVASKMNQSINHIPAGLERIERRTGRSYACLLLLSDDVKAAREALITQLGDTYDVTPLSSVD